MGRRGGGFALLGGLIFKEVDTLLRTLVQERATHWWGGGGHSGGVGSLLQYIGVLSGESPLYWRESTKFSYIWGVHPNAPPLWESLSLPRLFLVFLRKCGLFFLDLFQWSCIILSSKNWQSLIFAENSFLLIFGLKGLQNKAFCIFLEILSSNLLICSLKKELLLDLNSRPKLRLLKFQFLSYCLRYSHLIRLQDSRKSNISKKNRDMNLTFCM